jgi:RHS repeat-associated protein
VRSGSNMPLTRRPTASITVEEYVYGPFGEVIRATGPMAKANPFRFSTKFQDNETDLLYYGYRYYSASTGRWLSRDPIEEAGGENIYAFPLGDPVNQVDYLGQAGALNYTTKDKTAGECGGFNWTIHWKLKKAKSNSSIVQHTQWSFSVSFCPPTEGPVDLRPGLGGLDPNLFSSYWEAWGVQAGATDSYSGGGDDSWHLPDIPFGDGTEGTVTIHGHATYYSNVPFPPHGFYTSPGPAGTGFWTPNDPGLTGGSGTVTRTLTAKWNCCCGSKDRKTKLTTN